VNSDLGYFGPDSVTWRVHAEPVTMIGGGLRALLLQALHPEAMALISARSRFREAPWPRLHRTAEYVATVSFGTTAEAEAAIDRVRAVHARLGVNDPEQLAWVHACEVDSFLVAADYTGVTLPREDADRYLVEQARVAAGVGVPDELIPTTTRELAAFIDGMRPRLALTRPAIAAARVILVPPLPVPPRYVLPARIGWTTVSSLAVGMLPAWARRMYRLPPLPGRRVATTMAMRSVRAGVTLLPDEWRHGPHYRAARERAALAS
jgi:uncharacterized protein (DUF2236 family)